jgi:magnesium-transporting ATPase (P-type)
VPFSSDRKRMSVIFYHSKKQKYYIFSKGAPEILIDSCKYYINKTSNTTEINETWRNSFEKTISEFSEQSLRNILLCYREITKAES